MTVSPHDQARILSEALPHMQRYDEETVVIKYGGHAMGEEEAAREFARDIVLLEQTAINPVVVHGGGPQIAAMLGRLGIKSQFAGGLRVTDAATVEIVEMVLAGSINKQIVSPHQSGRRQGRGPVRQGRQHGDRPQGRAGAERRIGRRCRRSRLCRRAGEDRHHCARSDHRPRTHSGAGTDRVRPGRCERSTSMPIPSQAYIAGALKAKRLLLLTDVPGVLDKSKKLIPELSVNDIRKLIADGTISGGMIPKVETCITRSNGAWKASSFSTARCSIRRAARVVHRSRCRHADHR